MCLLKSGLLLSRAWLFLCDVSVKKIQKTEVYLRAVLRNHDLVLALKDSYLMSVDASLDYVRTCLCSVENVAFETLWRL